MRRTLLVLLMLLALTGCGLLGGQGAGKTNPVKAVFKDPLTTAELRPAVLTIEDLPTGWAVDAEPDKDEEDSGDTTGSTPECTRLWDSVDLDGKANKAKAVGEADAKFMADEWGPFLIENLASYKGSTVKNAIATIDVALKKCRKFTERDKDGATTTFTVSPLSFPDLGDRTVAGKLSGKEPTFGITFVADFVMVRVDQSLIAVVTAGIGGGMEAEEFEKVVRTAVERVQAAS